MDGFSVPVLWLAVITGALAMLPVIAAPAGTSCRTRTAASSRSAFFPGSDFKPLLFFSIFRISCFPLFPVLVFPVLVFPVSLFPVLVFPVLVFPVLIFLILI